MNPVEGDRLELTVGPVAHGGHCVARHDNRVIFVRHALPGERVVAVVTEERPTFLRADAVEILSPSPDRVAPPCPFARPDACGGCDLQHVAPDAQREWKTAVVREQLSRLAGLDSEVRVGALPGGMLGWRTRVRYAVSLDGAAGLLKHRSHEVVPIDFCRIAHPAIQALPVTSRRWSTVDEVAVVAPSVGAAVVVADDVVITERAIGRRWTLDARVFWQGHPAAADTFAAAVRSLLAPRAGDRVWDLYGGAGLFSAALAPLVAPGEVTLVESSGAAARAARENVPGIRVVHSRVDRALHRGLPGPDLVVLDPPRSGAGSAVVRSIVAAGPRAVAYVSCDPATFARDVRTFQESGWRLAELRAYDAFPMTHHVECVGLLVDGPRS